MGLIIKRGEHRKEINSILLRLKTPMDRSVQNMKKACYAASYRHLSALSFLEYYPEYYIKKPSERILPAYQKLLSNKDKNIVANPIDIEYTFYCQTQRPGSTT